MTLSRRAVLVSLASVGVGCVGSSRPTTTVGCPVHVGDQVDARLGFTGDVMLGRGVDDRWKDGPPAGVWGNLQDRLASLDGLFVNLECCLSDRGEARPGRTYHFRANPEWAVPALRTADVTWTSLANNHVMDFGTAAFTDTLTHLTDAGIAHAGAGKTRSKAIQPSIVEIAGLRLAIFGLTDRSPAYAATVNRPGTAFVRINTGNPATRRTVDTALKRANAAAPDLVVASLHWGQNWETHPSRAQRRFARWLVDRGVDIVHGHSAHVIQGIEVYRGRPIIHDAGDFVDDYAVKPGLHNDRSFLFEAEIEDGQLRGLHLHPIQIDRGQVTSASGGPAVWLRQTMRSRAADFGTSVDRKGAGLWIPLAGTCH